MAAVELHWFMWLVLIHDAERKAEDDHDWAWYRIYFHHRLHQYQQPYPQSEQCKVL